MSGILWRWCKFIFIKSVPYSLDWFSVYEKWSLILAHAQLYDNLKILLRFSLQEQCLHNALFLKDRVIAKSSNSSFEKQRWISLYIIIKFQNVTNMIWRSSKCLQIILFSIHILTFGQYLQRIHLCFSKEEL